MFFMDHCMTASSLAKVNMWSSYSGNLGETYLLILWTCVSQTSLERKITCDTCLKSQIPKPHPGSKEFSL